VPSGDLTDPAPLLGSLGDLLLADTCQLVLDV
jgi:hypothetical protein